MAINYKKFGIALKKIRKSMSLNQMDVYKATGISVDTQRIIEGGSREPRLSTLERLSEVYKTDLIFLLTKHRDDNDYFSDVLLNETNHLLNQLDLKTFVKKIDTLITQIIKEYEGDRYKRNNLQYVTYLKSFRDMGLTEAHFNEQNSYVLEKILLYFNKTTTDFLDDPAMYNLELQTGITLAIVYRFNNRFDDSIEILNKIIRMLEAIEYKSLRQIDYLVHATLNLSYCYHRTDDHQMVIDLVDQILQAKGIYFCRESLVALLLRKAVAYLNLDNDDYKSLFAAVLIMETPERALDIRLRAKSTYGFDPIEFLHAPQPQTLDGMQIDEL